MARPEFFRGARVQPKPQKGRLAEDVGYGQFVIYMAYTAITEYGQRDKEKFLRHVATAFDGALQLAVPAEGKSEGTK